MCNKYCAITIALIAFLIVNETIITWSLDLGNVVCDYRGTMDYEWWAISIYIAAVEVTLSAILASAVWGCGIVAIARERRGDVITYPADTAPYTGGNVRLD